MSKVAIRIIGFLLAIGLMFGNFGYSVTTADDGTETISKQTEKKDTDYYLNFFKISDEEVSSRLENFDMKYPEAPWTYDYINTLVIKDGTDYKVLPVYTVCEKYAIMLYDLSTEEFLFRMPKPAFPDENGRYTYDSPLKSVRTKADYLQDKELVYYGNCMYQERFLEDIIEEYRARDQVDYRLDTDLLYRSVYEENLDSFRMKKATTREILSNYVKYVPPENQVSTKEMGLEICFREEDKFSDCYKISTEEVAKRMAALNIASGETVLELSYVGTLVFKDRDDHFKLMMVRSYEEGTRSPGSNEVVYNRELFYDLFTGEKLFDAPLTGPREYDEDTRMVSNLDFDHISNAIPYFNDKKICYLSGPLELNDFIYRNIRELSRDAGVDYKSPCTVFNDLLYPAEPFFFTDCYRSINEIANLYVRYPEGYFVTAKELGFD